MPGDRGAGPATWTTAQAATGERLRSYAEPLAEGKEAIEIGSWESLRQALGDLYAGREVQKAYKLTWAAGGNQRLRPCRETGGVRLDRLAPR